MRSVCRGQPRLRTNASFSHFCGLFLFDSGACPNSPQQFEAIKGYLKAGGSAAFLLGEGGEERLGTNVNYLLEEYGMTVHKDSVVSIHKCS